MVFSDSQSATLSGFLSARIGYLNRCELRVESGLLLPASQPQELSMAAAGAGFLTAGGAGSRHNDASQPQRRKHSAEPATSSDVGEYTKFVEVRSCAIHETDTCLSRGPKMACLIGLRLTATNGFNVACLVSIRAEIREIRDFLMRKLRGLRKVWGCKMIMI
ncbi:hypothetical protein K470DRAFT_264228 [Piedraia hortae CBS 480.64]|uniref:Uncharacterized protein n=1 Tax=Piedraia hortae CBS 480.64 TaxID=1314780 RepID=A0A6A7C0C5_9PEZI|nr:hypothetical protein K470DRAFT_264228 [Piedraia hortae CBS 480.64]